MGQWRYSSSNSLLHRLHWDRSIVQCLTASLLFDLHEKVPVYLGPEAIYLELSVVIAIKDDIVLQTRDQE